MSNFICLDCEREFDQFSEIVERHGLDTPPYEINYVCPFCYSSSVIDAKYCDICGSVIVGDYIVTKDGGCYCSNCYSEKSV